MKLRKNNRSKKSSSSWWIYIGGCVAAGLAGSLVVYPAIPGWYLNLNKPWFTPPGWLFGPVWTILYALMGWAAYLAVTSRKSKKNISEALSVFWLQFGLNILWSLLFFGLKSLFLGLVDIVALWIAIIGTILMFNRLSKTASYLLVPYLFWVSFAMVLMISVYLVNS